MTVIGVAIIAYLLALNPSNTVMGLVSYAMGRIWCATFGPLILLSLYWKRMNREGAFAGLIAGGLTTILWKYTGSPLYEIVPGFVVATAAIITVSLLTKEPTEDIQNEFKEAYNAD